MRQKDTSRQRGASIVHWLLLLVPMMGFGVFAIDLNNVYLSLAQLQNAADAGSLEGARLLYSPDGTINVGGGAEPSALAGATNATQANLSQGIAAEVVSVNRGHWEFTTTTTDASGIERGGVFTPNGSTEPADLVDADGNFRTFQDLNQDPDEINAVEVVAGRQLTPVQSFFGSLLGFDDYPTQATSVAYVGFAGSVAPFEFDIPIAMCQEVLTQGCDVGRLVPTPDQTGGWTNLLASPPGTCGGAANSGELKTLVGDSTVCGGGGINSLEVPLGYEIPVNNGQVNAAFSDMYNCWKNNTSLDTDGDGWPDRPMVWTMPVVSGCAFGGFCSKVIGAIRVEVLWMFLNDPNNAGANNIDNTAPRSMEGWSSASPEGEVRWNSFVDAFSLVMDSSGMPATFEGGGAIQKTLYFKPECDPVSIGGTGGANYGVRAEVPVLVR